MNLDEFRGILIEKLRKSRYDLARFSRTSWVKLELEKHTKELPTDVNLSMRCWHIINDVSDQPTCKHCEINIPKFNANKWGYLDYCSVKCQRNSSIVKNRLLETLEKKYGAGVSNPYQAAEVKDKIRLTMMERHGTDHSFKLREKIRDGNIRKYGVDHFTKTPQFSEKYRKTLQLRYGVDHYSQTEDFKIKFQKTCLKRFGVDHPMKDPDHLERVLRKVHTFKDVVLPSGRKVKLQGYEPEALLILLQTFSEDDIIIGKRKIKEEIGQIEYADFKGKKRFYFPDFYIRSCRKVIEVKSTWTYDKNGKLSPEKNINFLKRDACLLHGLDFQFMII